jgi:hypothetical protein
MFFGINFINRCPFLSHWTPCPDPSKEGDSKGLISCISYNICYYSHARRCHPTGSGPRTPNSSTRFPSYSVAVCEAPGPAHSTEGLGPCDTETLVQFCTISLWTPKLKHLKVRILRNFTPQLLFMIIYTSPLQLYEETWRVRL